jgi:hypothetical protein
VRLEMTQREVYQLFSEWFDSVGFVGMKAFLDMLAYSRMAGVRIARSAQPTTTQAQSAEGRYRLVW